MKTPENLAKRYNSGKLQWSLVHYPSLEPMVKVLEFGAEKYDRHNWKRGLEVTKVCESMLRHIYAFLDGQDTDNESKCSHIGHIQANAMFLAYMIANHPNVDDRGVKEVVKDKQNKLPDHVIRGLIQHKKYNTLKEAEWITEQINEYKARRHTVDYDKELWAINRSMDMNSSDVHKLAYLGKLRHELLEDREEVVNGLADTLNRYTVEGSEERWKENTTTCSNDKLHVNLMGGHYVGNIESEESKSIIDSKV